MRMPTPEPPYPTGPAVGGPTVIVTPAPPAFSTTYDKPKKVPQDLSGNYGWESGIFGCTSDCPACMSIILLIYHFILS